MKNGNTPPSMAELFLLPMFYLLPQEILDVTSYADFPRSPYQVRDSDKWMEVYRSEHFQRIVLDGMGNMVWRQLGIKAMMESYSGYSPLWILCRLDVWLGAAIEKGWNVRTLSAVSPTFQFPVFSLAEADFLFYLFVKSGKLECPVDEIIAIVKEYPAHEDYDPAWNSRGKRDFYRKWYHSRAKTKVDMLGDGLDWERMANVSEDSRNQIDLRIDCEYFRRTLSSTDQKIWDLMLAEYTQEQIAKILGFANHTPVTKRIKKMRAAFLEYQKEEDYEELPRGPKAQNNWDEMTALLFPKKQSKS
ncbi:hypothetical protein LJC61_03390 [Ruminococcaceae bacterium OttesenSCG-928-A16]|nr:hypothetical protein [Ruminococcaceae bacterium OttesenSCG-928-A16]